MTLNIATKTPKESPLLELEIETLPRKKASHSTILSITSFAVWMYRLCNPRLVRSFGGAGETRII